MLASPSPTIERESMEEDDSVHLADAVDLFVLDLVRRDIAEMGQKRKPAWVCQTLQDVEGHAAP